MVYLPTFTIEIEIRNQPFMDRWRHTVRPMDGMGFYGDYEITIPGIPPEASRGSRFSHAWMSQEVIGSMVRINGL